MKRINLAILAAASVVVCAGIDEIEEPNQNDDIAHDSNIACQGTSDVPETTVTIKLMWNQTQRQSFNDDLGQQDFNWSGTLTVPSSGSFLPSGTQLPQSADVEMWRDGMKRHFVVIDLVQ